MYEEDAFLNQFVDNTKSHMNKIISLIAKIFIVISILEIVISFLYADINIATYAIPYIVFMNLIIIGISVITILIFKKKIDVQLNLIIAIACVILTILSILGYFFIYDLEKQTENIVISFYDFSFKTVVFSFLFYAQYYLRHVNDKYYQDKSEILSRDIIKEEEI